MRPPLSVMLAVLICLVFPAQLIYLVIRDAFKIISTRVGLLGFLFTLCCGFMLFFSGLQKRLILIVLFLGILMLIAYITLVMVVTSTERSIVFFLVSPDGLLTWFLSGLSAALMLHVMHTHRNTGHERLLRTAALLSMAISTVMILSLSSRYITTLPPTLKLSTCRLRIHHCAGFFSAGNRDTLGQTPTALVVGLDHRHRHYFDPDRSRDAVNRHCRFLVGHAHRVLLAIVRIDEDLLIHPIHHRCHWSASLSGKHRGI